jgi:hypothetical protein
MGWSIRRSINFGPFRVNLSKKGPGFSVGGPGFRVGRDATGRDYTQMSIPGTGVYSRQYYRKNSPPTSAAPPSTPPSPSQPRPISPTITYMITLAGIGGALWFFLRLFLR